MTRAAPEPGVPRPIPGRIGGVLNVLRTLVAHARHFAATVAARAATVPEFVAVAAIFGTHDVPVIQSRVQRGILRALALQRYLLARAERGRNLRFAWPPRVELQPRHRPPPASPPAPPPAPRRHAHAAGRRPDPSTLDPADPAAYCDLSPEGLDAWVRRRPVGRTMAYICLDLGVVPLLCDGAFWNKVEKVLRRYGGSLNSLYHVRARRADSFQRERDRRPETWHIDWRQPSKPAVRAALGCLIGETPPPPSGLMPGVPAAAPS